jgi:hypothetical protein
MPFGARMAIGIPSAIFTLSMWRTAQSPNPAGSGTFYFMSFIFFSIAVACFWPRSSQKKPNIDLPGYRLNSRQTDDIPSDDRYEGWRSKLSNFDVGRITPVGWIFSIALLFLVTTIGGLLMQALGIDSLSSRSRIGKIFGWSYLIIYGILFVVGRSLLESKGIVLIKGRR